MLSQTNLKLLLLLCIREFKIWTNDETWEYFGIWFQFQNSLIIIYDGAKQEKVCEKVNRCLSI